MGQHTATELRPPVLPTRRQATIELALPPNRDLTDMVVRIDLAGLRDSGYKIPPVTRVRNLVEDKFDRFYSMPGGGWEMQFPYPIPPEFVQVIKP